MTRVLHATLQLHQGGAARAVKRLCEAQRSVGLDAQELIAIAPDTNESQIPLHRVGRQGKRLPSKAEAAILAAAGLRDGNVRSLGLLPSRVPHRVKQLNPDIINTHWVGGNYLAGWQLSAFDKPVVWTMHDLWAASGALHYPADKDPRLDPYAQDFFASQWTRRSQWLEKALLRIKRRHLRGTTIVAPTTWLMQETCTRLGIPGLDIHQIPIPIPTHVFTPSPKQTARQHLGLDLDRPIVGYASAANDSYAVKGAQLLPAVIATVLARVPDALMVTLGPRTAWPEEARSLHESFSTLQLPYINNDQDLAQYYSSLDVLVVPSLFDTFNQVAAEALSCGTPVVAFDNTGLATVVQHGNTGLLAPAFNAAQLGENVAQILQDHSLQRNMNLAARDWATTYWSYPVVAQAYADLYKSL